VKGTDATKRRRRLLAIRKSEDLTNVGIAELAGAKLKTVESWLSTPGTASHRPLPAYRLELIELRLKARKASGAKP
jgi:hypothetical protein